MGTLSVNTWIQLKTIYFDPFCLVISEFGVQLGRNALEVRVTSGQKPSAKIIYIVLQTSVGLF